MVLASDWLAGLHSLLWLDKLKRLNNNITFGQVPKVWPFGRTNKSLLGNTRCWYIYLIPLNKGEINLISLNKREINLISLNKGDINLISLNQGDINLISLNKGDINLISLNQGDNSYRNITNKCMGS